MLGAQVAGVLVFNPNDAAISGVSILDGDGDGIRVRDSATLPCEEQPGGCSVAIERALVLDSRGAAFAIDSAAEWSIRDSIANGNGSDFPDGEPIDDEADNIMRSETTPVALGTAAGECAVYIPDDSPASAAAASGEDIGANILWRIVGDPTDVPLWDPMDGFPCGPAVGGVNETCGALGASLHAFTDGCPPPPEYADTDPCG